MKKNAIGIILEAAMAVLPILMYKKTAINLESHEIGGLVAGDCSCSTTYSTGSG